MQDLTNEITETQLNKIPWQTLGVLLIYKMGLNPRDKMSPTTYYSHKKVLKAYGVEMKCPDPK